jgi:hypothetical protein
MLPNIYLFKLSKVTNSIMLGHYWETYSRLAG